MHKLSPPQSKKRHAKGVPFLRPPGAISCCILPSAKQAGQALRRAPHKIPRKSPALPDFYSTARAAAARPRPLCGREGGIVSGSGETGNVSRGGSVPPGSPQARKKTACIHRRPFPQRVGKKSKERKNNERYKQINGRSDCRTLPHGLVPSAQNLHDNHWKASLQASQNNHECSS